jgi:3-(methylthio)propionyl---CoA ligase
MTVPDAIHRNAPLQGGMQTNPLLVSSLIEHAARNFADTEIVSRTVEGGIHRYTWVDANRRAKRLANALKHLGITSGEKVGTIAWNGYRHLETYYAVSGMGAVIHTINPRLFPEQIAWIIQHAADHVLMFDLTFVPLIEKLAPQLTSVRAFVVMSDHAHCPTANIPNLLYYEDLINAESDDYIWPSFDENTASSLCYTSGTTGNPKGVLYSHRSTVLHTYAIISADAMGITARDVVLPVVPMFHVNAWGLPYSCAAVGCKLVMPGPALDGASLYALMEAEQVTFSAGVPTIWQGLLHYMQTNGLIFSSFRETVIGGAACPPSMIKTFEEDFSVNVVHAWGMTELSPLGSICRLRRKHDPLTAAEKLAIKSTQGTPTYGVTMKIVDDSGATLPHDGKAYGDLMVKGPWVIERYFGETDSALKDGWFHTGDVARISADGYMQITDRSKDVIKSGGEWISSIELENIAVSHPAVAQAAVVGVAHAKWGERPLLIVVLKKDSTVDRAGLLAHYEGRIAKWMIPDDVAFAASIPLTATGKILKTKLRETYQQHVLPG